MKRDALIKKLLELPPETEILFSPREGCFQASEGYTMVYSEKDHLAVFNVAGVTRPVFFNLPSDGQTNLSVHTDKLQSLY